MIKLTGRELLNAYVNQVEFGQIAQGELTFKIFTKGIGDYRPGDLIWFQEEGEDGRHTGRSAVRMVGAVHERADEWIVSLLPVFSTRFQIDGAAWSATKKYEEGKMITTGFVFQTPSIVESGIMRQPAQEVQCPVMVSHQRCQGTVTTPPANAEIVVDSLVSMNCSEGHEVYYTWKVFSEEK